MDNDDAQRHPKPTRADLISLVKSLLDLRDALEETSLALCDYQCTLDSAQRRAAQLQVLQLIDRAKARDYSAGEGH
jgi:uncharacterized protein YerC